MSGKSATFCLAFIDNKITNWDRIQKATVRNWELMKKKNSGWSSSPHLILLKLQNRLWHSRYARTITIYFTLLEIKINRFSRYWSKLIGVKTLPLVVSLLRIVPSQILIISSNWPLFLYFRFGTLNSIIKFDRIIFNECNESYKNYIHSPTCLKMIWKISRD